MKRLILLAIAAVAVLAGTTELPAQSQYTATSFGVTNNVAANTTNTGDYTIGVTKHDLVAIAINFEAMEAGVSNTYWQFQYSIDGTTNWSTLHSPALITLAANGTTPVHFTTNWNVGAIGYIRLDWIGNNFASTPLTNISVKYAVKPKRQG